MPSYHIIAELPAPAALTYALFLDGSPTGVKARLVALTDPAAEAVLAALATELSATVNLLPGANPAESEAAATANSWAYNAALTAPETTAIQAARDL